VVEAEVVVAQQAQVEQQQPLQLKVVLVDKVETQVVQSVAEVVVVLERQVLLERHQVMVALESHQVFQVHL
jgi:hypothetical protein